MTSRARGPQAIGQRELCGLVTLLALLVTACGAPERSTMHAPQPQLATARDAVPRSEPRSPHGNPVSYVVNGRRYYTRFTSRGYLERGIASWYGPGFHGRRTSSGERYDMYAMTAAHRTLPLPSYVQVTNIENGRRTVVRVNDRGPFKRNRIIDLSYAAAYKLGILGKGTAFVEVRAIETSPPPGPARLPARLPVGPTSVATDSAPATSGSVPVADEVDPGHVYLQVGAFVHRPNAERLRTRLASLGSVGVRIRPAVSGGRLFYRVQVGPLREVAQADRISRRLAAWGFAETRLVLAP